MRVFCFSGLTGSFGQGVTYAFPLVRQYETGRFAVFRGVGVDPKTTPSEMSVVTEFTNVVMDVLRMVVFAPFESAATTLVRVPCVWDYARWVFLVTEGLEPAAYFA